MTHEFWYGHTKNLSWVLLTKIPFRRWTFGGRTDARLGDSVIDLDTRANTPRSAGSKIQIDVLPETLGLLQPLVQQWGLYNKITCDLSDL